MAEEYCGGANWWDNRSINRNSNRFDSGGGSTASSATTLSNSTGGGGGTTGYGWLTESTTTGTKLDPSSVQLMGLGLSNSPSMEWNQQHILNSEKTEHNFRPMMQDGGGGVGLPPHFQENGVIFGNNNTQPPQWRSAEKLFPNDHEESSEFKHQIVGGVVRGFSLDQNNPQFSPSCSSIESSITCNNNNQGFQLDSSLSPSVVYGSPSSILQGLMGHPDQQHSNQQHLTNNYPQQQQQQSNYFDIPQFLKTPSPKQQQQQQQLQFMNNGPYWNASGSGGVGMNDNVRPNFFSSLQAPPQLNLPTFEEKPKAATEMREMNSISKKTSSQETNTKRARNDGASSALPPFKVRKEKMGDRITALQQLVSPFGKTDTASVLSEAIEYIKFLHEQVSVLSNPYLKSGAPYQQQQHPGNEKGKGDEESPKQDLRSRGLCLVPVSSTFPVTHETTVDFWTPTFGGTFR